MKKPINAEEQQQQEENRRSRYFRNTEEVNGTIIGAVTFPYSFHRTVTIAEYTYTEQIARNFFQNDEEAVTWFKANYPKHFAAGVEMRCYQD
jgi:hypothetical protein